MSVFSMIRKGRAQAKAASKKKAQAEAEAEAKSNSAATSEAAPARYRHVPTHAAADALSGAPHHMQPEDRSRIAAYNRRYSTLPMSTTASSSHSLFRGITPSASGTSSGSSSSGGGGGSSSRSSVCGAASASSASKRTSRTYSYAGGHPQSWHGRMGEVLYADSGAPPPVPSGLWADSSSRSGKGKAREEPVTQTYEHSNAAQPGPGPASETDPASTTASSAANTSPSSSSIESLSDDSRPPTYPRSSRAPISTSNHTRSASAAHRLHPAGRPRTASDITGSAAALSSHVRTPSALSSHTVAHPILPDAQAAGFVFPFSAGATPVAASSSKSLPSARPATAGAESRRGPPVSFSGSVARAVAQASALRQQQQYPYRGASYTRGKTTRFTELGIDGDSFSLPALPAFPSLLVETTSSLTGQDYTTSAPDGRGVGNSGATGPHSRHFRRATDTSPSPPPLGQAQSCLAGTAATAFGSSVSITSTVPRPPSRQSISSLASVSRIRGIFSLTGGKKLRKGRRDSTV